MYRALVEGKLVEAFTGGRGICRGCQGEVIGRDGEIRIRHWAHKPGSDCPAAKKEETPWHRLWKDKYPIPWQEFHSTNPVTCERHFADVRTDKGLVLEFQNSPINANERRSREAHYGNMLWVVNATRNKFDFKRFFDHVKRTHPTENGRWHYIVWPDKAFPKLWQSSSVIVVFDFLGDEPIAGPEKEKEALWCLFPGRVQKHGLVAKVYRREFQILTTEREFPFRKPAAEVVAERTAGFPKVYDDWLDALARKPRR